MLQRIVGSKMHFLLLALAASSLAARVTTNQMVYYDFSQADCVAGVFTDVQDTYSLDLTRSSGAECTTETEGTGVYLSSSVGVTFNAASPNHLSLATTSPNVNAFAAVQNTSLDFTLEAWISYNDSVTLADQNTYTLLEVGTSSSGITTYDAQTNRLQFGVSLAYVADPEALDVYVEIYGYFDYGPANSAGPVTLKFQSSEFLDIITNPGSIYQLVIGLQSNGVASQPTYFLSIAKLGDLSASEPTVTTTGNVYGLVNMRIASNPAFRVGTASGAASTSRKQFFGAIYQMAVYNSLLTIQDVNDNLAAGIGNSIPRAQTSAVSVLGEVNSTVNLNQSEFYFDFDDDPVTFVVITLPSKGKLYYNGNTVSTPFHMADHTLLKYV